MKYIKTKFPIFMSVLSICALFLCLSCSKYLDMRPSTNVAIPSTLEDVELLLQATFTLNFKQPSSGIGMVDDFYVSPSVYPSTTPISQDAYIWSWQEYNWPNQWSRVYEAVNTANVALETLDKIPRTSQNQEQWNRLKGSALAFRANSFLAALWAYSKTYDGSNSDNDPGIALRYSSDISIPSVRSSVSECYGKIIADLKESIPLVSEYATAPTFPTKAAVYGLLARTYLSMRLYDEALNYSSLCLNERNELLDYNEVSLPQGMVTPFDPFNKEVIFSTIISGFNAYAAESPTTASVDTVLFRSYSIHDLRKAAFFQARANGEIQFRGSYSYFASRYFSGISTAEMYLTRAECLARANRISEAVSDIATLLKNRWDNSIDLPEIEASNGNELLELILLERRKELIGRNLRHMDIKRLNKEGRNIIIRRQVDDEIYELVPDDPRWAFPLPADIIAQTGMPQNHY